MIDITDKLRAGAHLFDEVMKVDAAKLGLQAAEVESRLDSLFLEFCKKTEIGIDIKVATYML